MKFANYINVDPPKYFNLLERSQTTYFNESKTVGVDVMARGNNVEIYVFHYGWLFITTQEYQKFKAFLEAL